MGDWLEFYASMLELNIWTSSTVTSVRQDPKTKKWSVVVHRDDKGTERIFHPVHVVLATGITGGAVKVPEIPGKVLAIYNNDSAIRIYLLQDVFQGQVLHSTQFKKASDLIGKKVVVVGVGTSGHDISYDCVCNEVGKYNFI
jgi:cation diffusion facilitator CzcD-associated flavoprotein CzcO